VHALRQPGHEAQLGHIPRLRLVIAEQVRGRLAPLVAREFDIAVNEDALPRHEYIVEDHVAVGFVEAVRQRIIEGTAGAREWPAWIELEPTALDRDGEAVGVVLIARLQRLNAA